MNGSAFRGDLTQDAERHVSRRKSRIAGDLEQRLTQLFHGPPAHRETVNQAAGIGWAILLAPIRLGVVLVVAAPPQTGLVATEWRAVEPRVHAPDGIHPALVG